MSFTVRFGLVDKPSFSYSFNGVVAVVENFTDLGIIFNNRMCYTTHCHFIARRAYARAKLILSCFF